MAEAGQRMNQRRFATPGPQSAHNLLTDCLPYGTVREEVQMKEGSGWRIAVGVVLVVALIAAAAALAWMAYNAGAAQTAGAVAPQSMAYRPHLMAPFGFGFIGCLVPLAFLFLVFGLFRLVVWGGMGRHVYAGGWGPRGGGMRDGMREHWRERMEELHREMHASGSGEKPADKPSV
jgi:hypothetical protein